MNKMILALSLALPTSAFAIDCEKELLGQYKLSAQANLVLEEIAKDVLETDQTNPLISIRKKAKDDYSIITSRDYSSDFDGNEKKAKIEISGSKFKPKYLLKSTEEPTGTLMEVLLNRKLVQCQIQLNDEFILYKIDPALLPEQEFAEFTDYFINKLFYDLSDEDYSNKQLTAEEKKKIKIPFDLKEYKKIKYYIESSGSVPGAASAIFFIPLEKIE